ncbi:MAG: methyltransferase domain-containing protein [Caldilineaceae bacterium]
MAIRRRSRRCSLAKSWSISAPAADWTSSGSAQVGPSGFVYGVDMTDEMLDLARRNAAKIGATNVEFRKGHLEDLPIEDNRADVIISNCVVNLSPEKDNTLAEAYRVLAGGMHRHLRHRRRW